MNYSLRLLTVFLWLPLVQHVLSASYSSKMCEKNETPCYSQLESVNSSEADCLMKYYPPNTEECEEWVFEGSKEVRLGTVKLETYVCTGNSYAWPAFNISFQHIKWNYLRMRFKLNKHNGYKKYKNSCREFHLKVDVADSQQLYVDRPWAGPNDEYYEEQYYGFEYDARSNDGHRECGRFLLEVPYHKLKANVTNITEWPLFVYVDITRDEVLTVHWAAAPRWLGGEEYDVHGYNVTLHHNTSSDGPEVVQFLGHVRADQERQFAYEVGSDTGAYRFGVQIIHPACGAAGCRISFSPIFNIKGNSRTFLIAVVGCSLLIPIVLCALHVLKKWLERPTPDVKSHPIVLIVYAPTHRAHIRVVKELATYLRTFCGVEALLHDIDMPKENIQEPFTWYCRSFERANFVMVVSSPLWHTNVRDTVYTNVENVALGFLKEKFALANMPQGNYFCVTLPYCDKDLPDEVIHLRRFSLMEGLDDMLRHVRGCSSILRVRVLPLPRPEVPGGVAHYNMYGGRLAAAIAKADTETHRDPGICMVGYSSSEHTDSTLCHQSSTPEVCEEAETSQDCLLEAEHRTRTLSPSYLANVREIARAENGRAAKKPNERHFFGENLKL